MKKIFALSIALIALLSFNVQAQEEDKPNSNIGISLEAGYSSLFLGPNLSPKGYTSPAFGLGAGATFFYELQYRHFLFRTGFGMDYGVNTSKFESPDYTAGIAEYPSMLYHYDFKNFRETTTYGIGYVPVMFGGLGYGRGCDRPYGRYLHAPDDRLHFPRTANQDELQAIEYHGFCRVRSKPG